MAIINNEIRTFSIDDTNWFSTGNIKRYFTLSELLQIEKSIKRTLLFYKKMKVKDSDVIGLNEELLNEEINGTSL